MSNSGVNLSAPANDSQSRGSDCLDKADEVAAEHTEHASAAHDSLWARVWIEG